MTVSGNEHVSSRGSREDDEVVVIRIWRETRTVRSVLDGAADIAEECDQLAGVGRIDLPLEPWPAEHVTELAEQMGRDDEVEGPSLKGAKDLGWRTAWG